MGEQQLRQWFVPGEGIERIVITTDIQRYLGNDATVRPGVGTADFQGIQGFWIRAYRNLTSAMIQDLKVDSAKWRTERQSGSQESYVTSATYRSRAQNNHSSFIRRDAESPVVDGPYTRPQEPRPPMDPSQPGRPYGQPDRGSYPPSRGGYPDRGSYPPDNRPYQGNDPMTGYQSRPNPAQPYGDNRYTNPYPPVTDGAPPANYPRPNNYYSGTSPPYDPSNPATSRPEIPYSSAYQPPQPGREPRSGYPPDYQDPRYATYPSPAMTVSSANSNPREPVTSPPQPSPTPYGSVPTQGYPYDNRRTQFR